MFKLQRLEISGFKSFADYTEIVFTGSGITAVVGPNGCGKSNVSDAISWVLGEQRAKNLRGGEMKDVIFQGTRSRKPGGMAEVVLHMVRDEMDSDLEGDELEDIDEVLSGLDDEAVDMALIEGLDTEGPDAIAAENNGFHSDEFEVETVKAAKVGSVQTVETRVKTKRHWRPRSLALEFAPGESVSVTRRLYLSGESEYQLNGKTCRLRDINDLFSGTGLAGAHYAIIEQGRIGQILSAKPADRRNLIEEAAGISKFRTRQRAAETRLESAKTNLGRISDIVSEVEKQVNSLRRQASKTRRFKILQEEFRSLLRQLYAAEGKFLSELSEELKTHLVTAADNETKLQAEVGVVENSVRSATFEARAAEESLAELRKIHAGNALERDRAEREHIYKSDQIVGLNKRIEVLRAEITKSKERLEHVSAEIERLRNDEQQIGTEHAATESELRESEGKYRAEAEKLATFEARQETHRQQLMQHSGAVERFAEIENQLNNNLDRLAAREISLGKETQRASETYDANQKHADELAAQLVAEEEKLRDLNREKETLLAAAAAARNLLRTAEQELKTITDEHSAKKHRLSTLRELEEKRAVYAPQVQKIFAEQEKIGVKLLGVLADKLNVEKEAETAVETLFGNYLEAVLVESLADARLVSEWMKKNDAARTAIIVAPKSETVTESKSSVDSSTIAANLGISGELAEILGDIFPREMGARLVANLEAAKAEKGSVLVDYEGNLLIGGRMFVGGRVQKIGKNSSLLAFKRELSQLEKECARIEKSIKAASATVEQARAELVEQETKTVDLQSLIIKVDRGIHGLQIQVRSAREEISRADRHRKVVADETKQIQAEIAELKQRIERADENRKLADAAMKQASLDLEKIAGELAIARDRAELANDLLGRKRMAAATTDERRRSVLSALRRVEHEAKDLQARIENLGGELADAEVNVKSLHDAIDFITDRISGAGAEIELEKQDLAAAIEALTAARQQSDKMSENLAEINRRLGEARNSRAEIEVRRTEAITRLRNAEENCHQELNVSLVDLVDSVEVHDEFVLENARREAEDSRQRLENFGAINMLALEELAENEERLVFLTTQRQDIIDSIHATEEALREIKQRSRERFKTAFEAINENFAVFFQELFGGGRGEMTLLESEDILEAGIEVIAQPPGKRLQNILLLSGGEKAMAAISLVLAIFKFRPSPFCLLDEVDAPLDDANVGRFASKIAEMSERTQFIVITHNKRTMEAARALYGVTMQEAGVSKVVSVKFD